MKGSMETYLLLFEKSYLECMLFFTVHVTLVIMIDINVVTQNLKSIKINDLI